MATDPISDKGTTPEDLAETICRLEKLEAQLADDYGMSGDIDSVEVFDETKARAFTQEDASSLSAVKDLYMLYQLRVLASSAKLPLASNREPPKPPTFSRLIPSKARLRIRTADVPDTKRNEI
ncbi:hypothetical protein IW261DRAFT_1611960 [Armillaria novae-zelandiae]|uniref:Uncharacterized protein n=1 Tax=Armillaria novae-zelandiae TaxID=153914 RepID=A0AA39NTR8_9AGAR|nr:hypothetical protein IW261DRAFT_1611960 [Armillaria novae-zelandiae]